MEIQDPLYGKIKIEDPLITELIETPEMQRLKKIHNNGIYFYFYPAANWKKFDHSVGVWYLLKKFGASREEQIAGLLHDISHKVMAHVMDHFYGSQIKSDHQDSIHLQVMNAGKVEQILKQNNFDTFSLSDLGSWALLDNELPNLCVDRLEYTLRDSLQINFSDLNLHKEILNNLYQTDNGLTFKTLSAAKKFADLSHKMQTEFWHINWGCYSYELMAEIIKYALNNNYISEDHFWLGDQEMIDLLDSKNDPWIEEKLGRFKNIMKTSLIGSKKDYDLILPYKCRIVDPWIGGWRLSEIDEEFKKKFEAEVARAKEGHYIKLNKLKNEASLKKK